MAFSQSTFAPIGAHSSDTPNLYSYKTSDVLALVLLTDYFLPKANQLEEGDFILIQASDQSAFVEVDSTRSGVFQVTTQDSKTAFGELKVESMTPITQISAQYGLLTNVLTVTDNSASGTGSIIDNKFTCDSGVAADGLASILTLRQLAYRAGQGAMARFTALFEKGVLGNIQAAGLITAENSFTFGFEQDVFGIIHAHDGMDELQELTLTVAAGAETAVITIDGTAYNVILSGGGTTQIDAFEIAVSLQSQVPNYNFTSNDNQVVAQSVLPSPQGSFAYTSPGTSVGAWVQLVIGLGSIRDFVAQADWNQNKMIDLDPLMGNVYQIQFQYLGFGAIDFFVEDSASGAFVLVHRIGFANKNTTPSVTNPTFRVGWLSINVGSTVSMRVQGSSAGAFVEGMSIRDTPPRSANNEQLSVTTALTNVLSVRNRISFGGKVNRAEIFPALVSASSQTNKAAFFKIILNPTFAAPVTFSYLDKVNSIAEEASDSVGVSGGQEIGSLTITDTGSTVLRFNEGQVTAIFPGTILCLAAQMSSGAASDCQATATWQEDL